MLAIGLIVETHGASPTNTVNIATKHPRFDAETEAGKAGKGSPEIGAAGAAQQSNDWHAQQVQT